MDGRRTRSRESSAGTGTVGESDRARDGAMRERRDSGAIRTQGPGTARRIGCIREWPGTDAAGMDVARTDGQGRMQQGRVEPERIRQGRIQQEWIRRERIRKERMRHGCTHQERLGRDGCARDGWKRCGRRAAVRRRTSGLLRQCAYVVRTRKRL